MSCVCCSPIRARYKRLVDNIYPEEAEEGLVKANMEKLVYYAARDQCAHDAATWPSGSPLHNRMGLLAFQAEPKASVELRGPPPPEATT